MKEINCAGIIVISYVERKILMIQHPEGHWGFPKGYQQYDEMLIKTAIREVKEETEVICNFILDTEKYKYNIDYIFTEKDCSIRKNVTFFVGMVCNINVKLKHSFKAYKWMSVEEIVIANINLQYKNIAKKISKYIFSEVIIKSTKRMNFDNVFLDNNISSKHLFSRLAPLLCIHKNFEILKQPNTIDSFYINKLINKETLNENDYFEIETNDIEKCWSAINLLPMLIYKHKKLRLLSKPCGCNIGERSIDLYLDIIKKFGCKVIEENGILIFNYVKSEADINYELPFSSFTGTSISIYLAITTDVTTKISNISTEPEIIFLINLLKEMGYNLELNCRELIVKGCSELISNCKRVEINEDRNILVTNIIDKLINNNNVEYVLNNNSELNILSNLFEKLNTRYYVDDNYLFVESDIGKLDNIKLEFGFYPKFCSDWQPLIVLLLIKHFSKIIITDKVFEKRYSYVEQLDSILYGFIYKYDDKNLEITVTSDVTAKTKNGKFKCLDIRAAATLFMALNAFKVENFEIYNIEQFFRGYSSISNFSTNFETRCKYDFI